MNSIYSKRCGLFIGFHGCDREVRDSLLYHPQDVRISTNEYDWLGWGFYVWENNLQRAWQWAKDAKVKNPSVLGVVYELGNCLDLMDSGCIDFVKKSYRDLNGIISASGKQLPQNRDLPNDENHDMILRPLDCAVINNAAFSTEQLYLSEIKEQGYSGVVPIDTVRGCFTEGGKVFNTEIYEKTHIQICIRNLNCIKGFFMPREYKEFPAVIE